MLTAGQNELLTRIGPGTPAGNLIQGLGGLLGGPKNAGTNAPAATNRTTQGEAILQGLGGLFNKPKAATNAPAKP